MTDDIAPPTFRVPQADRSLLAIPPLQSGAELVRSNRQLFAASEFSFHGRTLVELRETARREAIAQARSFTSSLIHADIPPTSAESLVVSGHQPELFHVGVWAKNFALAGVARQAQSVAVNLVIDNDTLNSTSIRLPLGSREKIRVERFPFDAARPTQPWEEALVRDRQIFESFGPRVTDQIRSHWGFEPLIASTWKAAVDGLKGSNRLCDGLTALRANVERSWGLQNLELPMSLVCSTGSFLWFVAHLLARLPQVHAVYNQTVVEYRRLHRLRNRMQPVPNLDAIEDWLEAPFWIWRRGETQRSRLFARRLGTGYELRDEKEVIALIPAADRLEAAVEILQKLATQGIRLRTRALTTTLFARVCLADLFLHGIGGARYDEMTDRICQRLFGFPPPRFLTVSATLHLPIGGAFAATSDDQHRVRHRVRDLNYNPDRHLNGDPAAAPWIAEKSQILSEAARLRESDQLRGHLTSEQHQRLATVNARLRERARHVQTRYESERVRIESEVSANALIKHREYPFVLYPPEQLREFLVPLSNMTFERNSQESKQPLDNGPQANLA